MPPARRVASAAPSPDQTILVGEVRIEPAIQDGEQDLDFFVGGGSLRGNAFLVNSERPLPYPPQWPRWLKHRIVAPFNRPFFVEIPRRKLYLVDCNIVIKWKKGDFPESIHLPADYVIDIGAGDSAVYIGTLLFKRDEFFRLKSATVEDHFSELEKDFGKRFPGVRVRKSLLVGSGIPDPKKPD